MNRASFSVPSASTSFPSSSALLQLGPLGGDVAMDALDPKTLVRLRAVDAFQTSALTLKHF